MRPDKVILAEILDCSDAVQAFIRGFDEDTFRADRKTQSAVIHQLLVLGEAAKQLSEEARRTFPDVPRREVAGMRDRLIHGYHEVDLKAVWDTARIDVPKLAAYLTAG